MFFFPCWLGFHHLFKSSWKWGMEKLMRAEEWGCPSKSGFNDGAPVCQGSWEQVSSWSQNVLYCVPQNATFLPGLYLWSVSPYFFPMMFTVEEYPAPFPWPVTNVNHIVVTQKLKKKHFWKHILQREEEQITNNKVTLIGNEELISILQNILQVYRLFQNDPYM